MVDYKLKLGIDYELSSKQKNILEQDTDTIVRALPGSGKTTILTLKIKNLLMDNPDICKICCISYTNVNVEDLEDSCNNLLNDSQMNKVEFMTFHGFCLNYVLRPFSYIYRSKSGLRPFPKVFVYKEQEKKLVSFMKDRGINSSEIDNIIKAKNIYYNFKYINNKLSIVSNTLQKATVNAYISFLTQERLIDFNLISLLAYLIVKKYRFIANAINGALDWIFIDEFQDVTEIQCRLIEEVTLKRSKSNDLKWFLVGDPNQSIYGFAGANPRSMYDMRLFLNKIHDGQECEIKLDESYRCSEEVLGYAKEKYNKVINKIRESEVIKTVEDKEIRDYLRDLLISEDHIGHKKGGKPIIRTSNTIVNEILDIKFGELIDQEVCCIGIYRFNSIDVYKEYTRHKNAIQNDITSIFSDMYKDYEDSYGFKYFSLFTKYIKLKYDFYNYRNNYEKSLRDFQQSLEALIEEKAEIEISPKELQQILVDTIDINTYLSKTDKVFEAFMEFNRNLKESMQRNPALSGINSIEKLDISPSDKIKELENMVEPTIEDFINHIRNKKNLQGTTFEIKHIHKIKGLEYEKVILQKMEDLPHKAHFKLMNSIKYQTRYKSDKEEIYGFVQELNKVYVMLTRSKGDMYIIVDPSKYSFFLNN